MEQQYIPLLMEIKKGSLLSGGGGGMSFWGVFFFFVSSPLSLLALLVKTEHIIYLVNILTILKLGLCGFTFSMYLNYDNEDIKPELNILLSLMYAFSGYNIMYYQNSMWLDIVYVFPVFMIAFREIIRNGRIMPYIICISVMVYLNYYISYMVILFTIISSFFLLLDDCEKYNRRRNSFKFMVSSLISALITAPVWLVSLIQVTESGRGESIDTRTGLFANWIDKYCLISAVSIVIFSVFTMFRDRKFYNHGINRFYKQMVIILLIGAFIDPVNKMWHTGSYQAYPLRYGFIIIFIGLVSAGKYISEMRDSEHNEKKTILICSAFALVYASAVILINTERLDSYIRKLHVSGDNAVIIIALSIIALTVNIFFVFSFRQHQITQKVLSVLMGAVFIFETVFSLNVYMKNAPDVTSRYKFTTELSDKINGDGFYRVKSQKRYFYPNMLEGMGYNTTAHYTSLTNHDFMNAMKRMGYSSYWMDVSSNGGTLMTDAFLMNKYVISVIGDFIGKGFYSSVNPLKVYINDDILDGAFISDVLPEDFGEYSTSDRMDFSALLCSKILKSDSIIQKAENPQTINAEINFSDNVYQIKKHSETESCINYSINVEGNKILYFDVFGNYSTNLTEKYFNCCNIYVNDELIEENYPSKKMNGIINLGQFKNQTVEIRIVINHDFEAEDFGLYLFDTDEFQKSLQTVNTARIEKNGNKIKITGNGDGYLYIPLTYSKGYHTELNGKSCDTYCCMDAFTAVKLDGGDFEFEAVFYPRGLLVSIIMMLAGVALLIFFRRNINRLENSEKLLDASCISRRFLTLFVSLIIYFGAFIFWII